MVFFFLSVIKVFYGASKILPIGLSTGNNTVKKPTKQRVDSNKAIYQPFTRPRQYDNLARLFHLHWLIIVSCKCLKSFQPSFAKDQLKDAVRQLYHLFIPKILV